MRTFQGCSLLRADLAVLSVLDLKYHTALSRIRNAREQLKKALRQVSSVPELVKSTEEQLEGWALRVRENAMPG